jgi:hypothetical protein
VSSEQTPQSKPEQSSQLSAEAEVGVRGLSLIAERLKQPERIITEGNPIRYPVTSRGEHAVVGRSESGNHDVAEGDVVATTNSGSLLVFPKGTIDRVKNGNSDTRAIVPVRVPRADATVIRL